MKTSFLQTLLATTVLAVLSTAALEAQQPPAQNAEMVYVAQLTPLNAAIAGESATGEARFTIRGDQLMITVQAQDAAPNIMHLQHVHGFTDARRSSCPTPAADVNHDGVIDLMETEPMAGVTMIPLHDDPVSMQIMNSTYPKASASGVLHYHKTVSLSALQTAFAKEFKGQPLDLDRRVVFIHGIAPTTALPASAASLGNIPAQVTLPVACGVIRRVQ